MNKISEAIIFATKVFDGHNRKCENHPAILHSLEAGAIAQTLTCDPEIVIATILHDVIEDAGVTPNEIEERFGKRVLELVLSETENKRSNIDPTLTWQLRKEEGINSLRTSNDIGVKILFLSDKLSNIRSLYRLSLTYGDEMWNMFHQKDKNMHFWYYESILDAIGELADSNAYKEYKKLVNLTFKGE